MGAERTTETQRHEVLHPIGYLNQQRILRHPCPLMEWSGRAPILPARDAGRGYEGAPPCPTAQLRSSPRLGIDLGKNSFHVVGLDRRGAIVLRQKWSRSQVEARLANMPRCLIGM
jgi:hypothetical protein